VLEYNLETTPRLLFRCVIHNRGPLSQRATERLLDMYDEVSLALIVYGTSWTMYILRGMLKNDEKSFSDEGTTV